MGSVCTCVMACWQAKGKFKLLQTKRSEYVGPWWQVEVWHIHVVLCLLQLKYGVFLACLLLQGWEEP